MLHAGWGLPRMGTAHVETKAIPSNRVDICSGANSEWGLSLLDSLRIRRRAPLIARLEWQGGLFLNLASTLFWGGERRGSGELSEDNSSFSGGSLWSGRAGSLPLFV